jgi:acyl-CoA thioesterase-1
MGIPQIPSVDSDSKLFPPPVLDALGSHLGTKATDVLMLGDSIIMGVGTTLNNDVVSRTKVWLKNYLGRDYSIVNAGVGGNTTGDMLARLPGLLASERPQVVTLSVTVNDLRYDVTSPAKDTIANLRKMVGLCRLAGALPVLVTNSPFVVANFPGSYNNASMVARPAQVAAATALATELGVPLANVDAAWNGWSNGDFAANFTGDGLHPADDGADIWGRVIAAAIAAQGAPATVTRLLSDDFARADADALGSTSVGGRPWTVSGGAWGIRSNRARVLSGTTSTALVNDGLSDAAVSVDLTTVVPGKCGVIFRAIDTNQYWVILVNADSTVSLASYSSGAYTVIGTSTAKAQSGDRLIAQAKGGSMNVILNGASVVQGGSDLYQSGTGKGLWAGGGAPEFDNFESAHL